MRNSTLSLGKWAQKGFKQPEEIKLKISEANKGHIVSKETRIKISEANKGRKISEATREKMRISHLGKKLSEATCLKMSLAQRGEKGSNWKGGVSKDKEYQNRKKNEYRHRVGLRKKYHHGLSYTPAYRRLQKQRRKALERGNGGRLSIKTIQLVYEDNIKKYGTLTCYLCFDPIAFGQDCLEHKIPLIRGGTNEYNNLAISHQSCNKRKHTKTEDEYRIYIQDKEKIA